VNPLVGLTEARHPQSVRLDQLPVREILDLMNREDERVVEVIREALPALTTLVEAVTRSLQGGGRLFYVGAGTSGRLGALDAAECPPTFGTPPEKVQAVLAGGMEAFGRAVEHAEDDAAEGGVELDRRGLAPSDFVLGLSASGRTPFVIGALRRARQVGAGTGSIFCNPGAPLATEADHPVLLPVGPEILTGSTRLKAGTATKMALNMVSTAVMVRLGHCLGNLMVDVRANSAKLRERQIRILAEAAGVSVDRAQTLLVQTNWDLRRGLALAGAGEEELGQGSLESR